MYLVEWVSFNFSCISLYGTIMCLECNMFNELHHLAYLSVIHDIGSLIVNVKNLYIYIYLVFAAILAQFL